MAENSEENTRPCYWASEIPTLLGPETPSLSSFYRYVTSGQIRKVDTQDQLNPGYSSEDVQRFLRGEMSRKKSGVKRENPAVPRIKRSTASGGKPIIDCAREISDLAHTSSMELKLKGTLSPQVQLSWIKTQLSWIEKNEYVYWFLSHSKARHDVWATLAVLPMPKETICRLLNGKVALENITSDDLLAPDQSPFSCYLSAFVRSDHEDSLLQLLLHVFAFWCEKVPPMQINKLYVLVPTGVKETPLHKLVKKLYFSPVRDLSSLPDQMVWELDFDFYNPSEDVQKVQQWFKTNV